MYWLSELAWQARKRDWLAVGQKLSAGLQLSEATGLVLTASLQIVAALDAHWVKCLDPASRYSQRFKELNAGRRIA